MSFEKIPKNEQENVLSVYWQMLREIEEKTVPEKQPLDKIMVDGAYRLWNRVNGTKNKPRWEKK